MVLQEILTILFATGAGVAVVMYASRPKHSMASTSMISSSSVGDSIQGTTSAVEVAPESAPVIEVQPVPETVPVVQETSVVSQPEVSQISVAELTHTTPMSFEPVTVPEVTAVPSITEAIESSPVSSHVEATAPEVKKAHRTQRKRASTSTGKTRTRTSQTRKHLS